MNLVIVESPAKSYTIKEYLGKDYEILASYGHVRDLPKKELGVEVEKDFEPKYIIPPKSRRTISAIRKKAKDAKIVYLATDHDREGEAISWHVVQACGLEDQKIKRITFTEITKNAILDAVKNPKEIDQNLVNAQQARRILDRLVGYKLSPFLWKKITAGLSAGRVQSIAVRLIVDREREIKNFIPKTYYVILAELSKDNKKFTAKLTAIDDQPIDDEILTNKSALKIVSEAKTGKWAVDKVTIEDKLRFPFPPFTTSTLQQSANYGLGFTSKKTMKLAQDLYEAGKITYMRTDSTNLSWLAVNSVRKFIEAEYGKKYLFDKAINYKTKSKGAQEAHEAIRSTYIETKPEKLKLKTITPDHTKLYEMIRNRTIACQMKPLEYQETNVGVKTGQYTFSTRGRKIKFDGFTSLTPIKFPEIKLPILKVKDNLKLESIKNEEKHTQPPARYSEPTLIKVLEKEGIGRPSTYVPIISTIQQRGYVFLQNRYFYPQEIGEMVTDLLVENFPDIVNIKFTANVEEEFDTIAEGKMKWTAMLKKFYDPFIANLNTKNKTVEKSKEFNQKIAKKCPKCQSGLIMRVGKFGKFIACTSYPKCKYTENIVEKSNYKCPKCKEGDVVTRHGKGGRRFWGCNKYPKCDYINFTGPLPLEKIRNPEHQIRNKFK